MEYKLLKNDCKIDNNFIKNILLNRGIENPVEYISMIKDANNSNNKEKYEYSYNKLFNIHKAVDVFVKHFENNDPISILVDSDVDGMTSAASMYNYIKDLNKNYPLHYIMHRKVKAHGLGGDVKVLSDTKLLIIPDAATNDADECKYYTDKGVDIIILDHHDSESGGFKNEKNEHVIIVNNQIGNDYPNKNLSGVGVVYKFLQALDEKFWVDYSDKYKDLNALGNISDVMDMRSTETRYLVEEGLKDIQSNQFKALLDLQSYSIGGEYTVHNIQWYISPLINGCIRYADLATQKMLFRGFINDYQEYDYKRRKTKDHPADVVKENIYDRAARLCRNAKNRQDKAVQKSCEKVIRSLGDTSKDKVLLIDATGKLMSDGITGLVAMKIADRLKKPCVLMTSNDNGFLTGSGRNINHSPINNLKQVVQDTGLFEFAQGHPNAFGVKIKESNLDKAQEKINNMLKNIVLKKTYYVDSILTEEELIDKGCALCKYCDDFRWLLGQGIPEITIAVEDVVFHRKDFNIVGKNKDTLQINTGNGVKYIMFRANDTELYDWVMHTWDENNIVTVNLVGKPSMNKFNDVITPQITIEDVDINYLRTDEYNDLDEDDIWA